VAIAGFPREYYVSAAVSGCVQAGYINLSRKWSSIFVERIQNEFGGQPAAILLLAGDEAAVANGERLVGTSAQETGAGDAGRLALDGVLVERHAEGGVHRLFLFVGEAGRFGATKGSQQGIVGVELQNRLPRARVIYASATGASDVNNLAYATRLGLWGEGTAFPDRTSFIARIREGGIAAMELVARELKAMGVYTARALLRRRRV
jgi:hypothetical protein